MVSIRDVHGGGGGGWGVLYKNQNLQFRVLCGYMAWIMIHDPMEYIPDKGIVCGKPYQEGQISLLYYSLV